MDLPFKQTQLSNNIDFLVQRLPLAAANSECPSKRVFTVHILYKVYPTFSVYIALLWWLWHLSLILPAWTPLVLNFSIVVRPFGYMPHANCAPISWALPHAFSKLQPLLQLLLLLLLLLSLNFDLVTHEFGILQCRVSCCSWCYMANGFTGK